MLSSGAMKKSLGDILVEDGKLSAQDLKRALAYQMRKVFGTTPGEVTEFILEVARNKYNNRDRYYLGRILTELKLLPEQTVRDALEEQKASPAEAPGSRLEALNSILVRMNSTYNLIDLLNQVLVLAAQLVDAECASLIIRDHARDSLVIVMPVGPGAQAVRDLEVPQALGIVGWVYANARSVLCNDVAADPRFYAGIDTASGYTSRQILCVPLMVKGKKLGAIEVINRKGEPGEQRGFTAEDLFLLEMLSTQAALAIENTRLAATLAQAEEDLSLHASDGAAAQKAHAGALVAGSLLEEMRQSLTPIRGYAARILERTDDERVRSYTRHIDLEMGRLIGHADDMARFLDGTLQPLLRPVHLAALLKQFESLAWVECRSRGITFSSEITGEMVVNADEELFMTVLVNLLRNSRSAMSETGAFSMTAALGGGEAVIEIADTGRGIDADPVEKVFEPFYTRGTPHGAGLGLPIARKIAELHGGDLRLFNRADVPGGLGADVPGSQSTGTLVVIRLPKLR
jgi:signal transduction histidine kinase